MVETEAETTRKHLLPSETGVTGRKHLMEICSINLPQKVLDLCKSKPPRILDMVLESSLTCNPTQLAKYIINLRKAGHYILLTII
jgi:hypothetical protein